MVTATGFEFVKVSDDWLRRVLATLRLVKRTRWMVYRFPWQRRVRVTHPDDVDPRAADRHRVRRHEFHHVQDFIPWWGPWVQISLCALLPLPVLFSGRWFVERRAYRDAIDQGWTTVDRVLDVLWSKYAFAWPRPLMRAWLEAHAKDPHFNLVIPNEPDDD